MDHVLMNCVDTAATNIVMRMISQEILPRHPELIRLGYFGSYARGDWGVGSDIDLLAIVGSQTAPFERRSLTWDLSSLPVAADLLVFSRDEWDRMQAEGRLFARRLCEETVWVYESTQ